MQQEELKMLGHLLQTELLFPSDINYYKSWKLEVMEVRKSAKSAEV